MEFKRIGDLCTISKQTVKPKEGVFYTLFSFPAFDNNMKPEVVDGNDIKSAKLGVSNNIILFNKLNVHFRRIWNIGQLYTENNVCSTEFLPLKIKNDSVLQDYLYYVLTSRELTQAMYGARRGTSGSQQRIAPETLLDYEIPVFPRTDQIKIASFLGDIDQRIMLGRQVKENLFEQMKAIYINGVQTFDERQIDDVIEFFDFMRKPLSSKQRSGMEKNYPYYGAVNIVDYVENYIFEGTYVLLSEDGAYVVDALGYPMVQYTYGKFWVNNHAHVLKGKNGISEALAFTMLKCTNMKSIVTGAAQPKINQANLKGLSVKVPKKEDLPAINEILSDMMEQLILKDKEITCLESLKDTLLPRMISGELSLDDLAEE